MAGNKFEIMIRIHDESELYNSFDPNQLTLNDDLLGYINNSLKERKRGEKTILHIISDSSINEKQFKLALDNNFNNMRDEFSKRKKGNQLNAIRMFMIGVFFILLGIALNGRISTISTTVIETLGSFSIWESANIWLEELPKLKLTQRVLEFLSDPEIKVEIING